MRRHALLIFTLVLLAIAGCKSLDRLSGTTRKSEITPITPKERLAIADMDRSGRTLEFSGVEQGGHYLDLYDYLSISLIMKTEDAEALERVRRGAAAYLLIRAQAAKEDAERREVERKRMEEEQIRKRQQDAARQAHEASPEGRRQRTASEISDKRDCIATWQRSIDQQRVIGRVSGVVDMNALYIAGSQITRCKYDLDKILLLCKREKTC